MRDSNFSDNGAPRGFGQMSPFRDRRRPPQLQEQQGQETPLMEAIRPAQDSPGGLAQMKAQAQPRFAPPPQDMMSSPDRSSAFGSMFGGDKLGSAVSQFGQTRSAMNDRGSMGLDGPGGLGGLGGGLAKAGEASKILPQTGGFAGGLPESPLLSTGGNTPNSGNWNTDGYAAPAHTAQNAGGVMAGWDTSKWDNQEHQTPKYAVGRILSQYPPTVEGLGQAMGEIEKAYPGATFNGKDKVTLPGVGTIDMLRGASVGGEGWQWLDEASQGSPAALGQAIMPGMTQQALATQPPADPAEYQDWLAKLLAQFQVPIGGK